MQTVVSDMAKGVIDTHIYFTIVVIKFLHLLCHCKAEDFCTSVNKTIKSIEGEDNRQTQDLLVSLIVKQKSKQGAQSSYDSVKHFCDPFQRFYQKHSTDTP